MVRYSTAIVLALNIISVSLLAIGCGKDAPAAKSAADQASDSTASVSARLPIEQVMTEFSDSLMAFPGVVSVGVGEDSTKPYIAVAVVERTPELEAQIPKKLGGYPVHIEETGEFRSDDDSIPPGD